MTRKSKIARLPRPLRDELNHRLDNGHTGVQLVEWLNSLPEVKEALARDFQGRRITPQNISEWKRGGYHDWLAQQEHAATLQDFLADAKELGEAASPEKLTEAIFNFVLVHYAASMQRSAYRPEQRNHPNPWSQMLNDVIRLRNCDLAEQRFELDTQKLAFNAEKLEIQTELARQRLDLDRARFELAHQKSGTGVNPEGVPAISPGLRRDAGRYPGKSSQKNLPNPERVVSRTAHDLGSADTASRPAVTRNTACRVEAERRREQPSSPSRPNPIAPAKTPLKINTLQPNPAKSNHPFFIFPQTTTVGHPALSKPHLTSSSGNEPKERGRPSPFSSTTCPQKPPQAQNSPQNPNIGTTQHATRNTHLELCTSCRVEAQRRRMNLELYAPPPVSPFSGQKWGS